MQVLKQSLPSYLISYSNLKVSYHSIQTNIILRNWQKILYIFWKNSDLNRNLKHKCSTVDVQPTQVPLCSASLSPVDQLILYDLFLSMYYDKWMYYHKEHVNSTLPGGGVSWMLFFSHHPTGKIFRELELHQMDGRLPSTQVITLSISTWKKCSLATLETVAAQMDDGSFGLTASSFNPVVKPWGFGKLLDWNNERFKHWVPHTCIVTMIITPYLANLYSYIKMS